MYTIGYLGKRFNISRSTLIYYDKINLLKASERSESNYRLYTDDDVRNLEIILRHREAGIPLEDIQKLLQVNKTNISEILTKRLHHIQHEISVLKKQEDMVLAVLMKEVRLGEKGVYTAKSWTDLLISIDYTKKDLNHWHLQFELDSPEEHMAFLVALGIDEDEIRKFRKNLLVNK